jgi:TolB-like protein/Tfp pilus assembly protein PilF/predicted Ser/Thr protein kinase
MAPLPPVSKDTLVAGKYRIVEEIGQGGMGVVFKAEDIKLERPVALKFLPPHLADVPELRERFLIEARAAAALSHPNICVIHEVGEDGGRPFIAMEYVEGETLRDRARRGALKAEQALAVAGQIAAGLGAAHRKGIVHRDVKSANIMVTAKGQAKVMDFGLAKLRGASPLTKSRTTLGTVSYMSPEQARGEEMDGRTDLWSLGVVLYEMLTAELPFKGDHDQAVIHAILNREPRPPSKIKEGLPSGLDAVVLRALAKKAGDRYASMEDLHGDLAAVAEGLKPLKARPVKKILGIRAAYVYPAPAAVLALLLGLNIFGLRDRILGGAGRTERAVKLAVMPLANLTGDAGQEPFVDGLTEQMIVRLGRLHPESLAVIARTSVMRYKGTETPVERIGRELGVEYVLEGSARREGSRVRITAELIKVRDKTQLWADSYDRELAGILALQNELAGSVAEALALKLLPDERARLSTAKSVNAEAYDAYLKGTQYWHSLKANDLDTAEKYFELALQRDPDNAAAYGGIALVWACRQQMDITPPGEAGPKARAAAQKAVALGDTSWEAHFALADILTWTDWDWRGGEREWRRTLELNPNNADALATYSHFLMIVGRPDEAMAQIRKALEVDPFNIIVRSFYAIDLLCVRRYDEAVAQARQALSLQADAPVALSALYNALYLRGRLDEVLALDKASDAGDPELLQALEKGFAAEGFPGSQKRWADVMAARHGKDDTPAFRVALGYLFAGEKDLTLAWLEKALAERDPNLPYVSCLPIYDGVRDDPRFQALVRRMGLSLGRPD